MPLRLLAFAIETHPPLVYALVSGGWAYSLMALMTAPDTPPTAPLAPLLAVVVFLVLLYLRAIDEIKDLPYDRIHHPERPVVRGAVSVVEVEGFAAGVAVAIVALCAWVSPWLALYALAQLGYGLGLLVLERRWQRFRESALLNLLLTFPVSAALNGLVWLALTTQGFEVSAERAWPTVAAHIAAFMHMEFGRKLVWPRSAQPGENGYTLTLGVPVAVTVCIAMGLTACALATHLWADKGMWALLPWLALVPSMIGLQRFTQDRHLGHGAKPHAMKPWFGGAMILFFALNTALGLRAQG